MTLLSECTLRSVVLSVTQYRATLSSSFARIENHYFVNSGWMRDGQLLEKQAIDKMYVFGMS